jgi:hypothetical protein
LAADAGMLFDFGVPLPVYMWMKNTYIALDMIFIAPDELNRYRSPDPSYWTGTSPVPSSISQFSICPNRRPDRTVSDMHP